MLNLIYLSFSSPENTELVPKTSLEPGCYRVHEPWWAPRPVTEIDHKQYRNYLDENGKTLKSLALALTLIVIVSLNILVNHLIAHCRHTYQTKA